MAYAFTMQTLYTMPGHLIRRLHQISTSIFADGMKQVGADLTSPQFAALSILHECPGIDQATLAGMIALDRPTIGGVVERLAAKGLVHRKTNDADRRAKKLTLTPEGEALLRLVQPVVAEMQPRIMNGLSQEEMEQFTRLAEKIALNGNDLSRAPLSLPAGTQDA